MAVNYGELMATLDDEHNVTISCCDFKFSEAWYWKTGTQFNGGFRDSEAAARSAAKYFGISLGDYDDTYFPGNTSAVLVSIDEALDVMFEPFDLSDIADLNWFEDTTGDIGDF